MRRRLSAVLVTVAVGAAGAGVAVGQGTGATVGAKAVGSTSFEVRINFKDVGFHCANTNNRRRCARARRPALGSLSSGSAGVFQDGQRVGTAHFTNVITKNTGGGAEMFFATVILGDGTITLQGASAGGDDAPSIPSSITGGSGAYAGARGFETEEPISDSRTQVRIRATLTFIP